MSTADQQRYRVSGDWTGGGFEYTIGAASHADALAWAQQRARFHPGAAVTATLRPPLACDRDLTLEDLDPEELARDAERDRGMDKDRRPSATPAAEHFNVFRPQRLVTLKLVGWGSDGRRN